jgi:hypothetical protein
MRYVAYAVDLWGVVHATYELECGAVDDARRRAAKLLEAHPVIKIWSGARRVERLTADAHQEKDHAASSSHQRRSA